MENWFSYIEDVGYLILMILSWVCTVVCCAQQLMWCHACIVFHLVSSLVAISSPPCPSSESVPAQTSVPNQGPVRFSWTLQWSGALLSPRVGPVPCFLTELTLLMPWRMLHISYYCAHGILRAFSSFHRHVFQPWLFSNTLDCFPSQICWRPDYAKEYK